MARKQAAYRKAKQNKHAIVLIMMVVLMITIAVGYKSIELRSKVREYEITEQQLENEIAEEQARTEELEEYEKYTHTKKYIEDVAKDKLGLVYKGEIIFKEDGSK